MKKDNKKDVIMSSKKGLKIEINPHESPRGMKDILCTVFWKEPYLVEIAVEFLEHVREWHRTGSPYRVNEWENYCTRKGITQSTYHNMLKRLRRAGMIEKTYNKGRGSHELHISRKFSVFLEDNAKIWNDFYRG